MIWAASTEVFLTPGPAHRSLQAFERAMEQNDPAIAPSMLYAYAALMENLPFANGLPNLTVDVPALHPLPEERKLPIGGKAFKTGQTMMKTVLAPAFKARLLGQMLERRNVGGEVGTAVRERQVLHQRGVGV